MITLHPDVILSTGTVVKHRPFGPYEAQEAYIEAPTPQCEVLSPTEWDEYCAIRACNSAR